MVNKNSKSLTVISLFAGCGGSSLGYKMAGYEERLAVEMEDIAVETFKLNFPGVPVYHGDIHNLSVVECLKLAKLKSGELDVLDGSPPCQGFSVAGKRKFLDVRNQLYNEYVRLLKGLQPRAFVLENVPGMTQGPMKVLFLDMMKKLRACGYRAKAQIMNAKWYEVPQSRKRLIVIGIRKDLKINAD